MAAVLAAVVGDRATISGGIDVLREGPHVVLVAGLAEVPEAVSVTPGAVAEFGSWRFGIEPAGWAIGGFDAVISAGSDVVVRTAVPGDSISIGAGTKLALAQQYNIVEQLRDAALFLGNGVLFFFESIP